MGRRKNSVSIHVFLSKQIEIHIEILNVAEQKHVQHFEPYSHTYPTLITMKGDKS